MDRKIAIMLGICIALSISLIGVLLYHVLIVGIKDRMIEEGSIRVNVVCLKPLHAILYSMKPWILR